MEPKGFREFCEMESLLRSWHLLLWMWQGSKTYLKNSKHSCFISTIRSVMNPSYYKPGMSLLLVWAAFQAVFWEVWWGSILKCSSTTKSDLSIPSSKRWPRPCDHAPRRAERRDEAGAAVGFDGHGLALAHWVEDLRPALASNHGSNQ